MEPDLSVVQLTTKAPAYLRIVVMLRTQHYQVRFCIVTRVIVYVVQLYWFARLAANATGSVRLEHYHGG